MPLNDSDWIEWHIVRRIPIPPSIYYLDRPIEIGRGHFIADACTFRVLEGRHIDCFYRMTHTTRTTITNCLFEAHLGTIDIGVRYEFDAA